MNIDSIITDTYSYNPETGDVFNKTRNKRKPIGSVFKNSTSGKHYKCMTVKNKILRVHRVAWFLHVGSWPNGQIDHINGNGTDNRFSNMRCVSHAENGRNTKKKANNTSGVNGVYKCLSTGKWRAEIMVNRKKRCLGRFVDIEDAKEARAEAEVSYGFYPSHGEDRPLY